MAGCTGMIMSRAGVVVALLLMISLLLGQWTVAEAADSTELRQIKRQIQQIKADEERQRARDEKMIGDLESRLDQLESQNRQLKKTNDELQVTSHKLQSQTAQQLTQIQDEVNTGPSPLGFARAFQGYLGTHQFTVTGGVGGDFIYDRKNAMNTFALDIEPIILYRPTDWLLFDATIEANLPSGSSAEFALPVATAQIFVNDYLTLQGGIFDQPFGDWYENQSAFWVNRFITAPLPYNVEALIPPAEVGVQARGGLQWGVLGQDFDYTAWIGNGPGFDDSLPQPVVGQALNEVNNIALSNTKALGARLRVYPLPLDSNLGRLELGASTLDGKWQTGNWYNAWGIDFAYLRGSLQARGEYLETYRQMPAGADSDNRQGWYVQLGYFLNSLQMPFLPEPVQNVVHKLEPLIRYSGVNQSAVVLDEISTDPEIGSTGSLSLFTPHAREVALGLDYWLAPSIVWQMEVDFELPEAGGTVTTFGPLGNPISAPQGATPNDVAFLSQFAIGF
jgi:hypothetical protein